jgi:Cdc6-like AAA superfamily ATPase
MNIMLEQTAIVNSKSAANPKLLDKHCHLLYKLGRVLDKLEGESMADRKDRLARLAQATAHFTPGSPIDSLDLFAGRTEQVSDILGAFHSRGQHVALYGERGVGKTSIANILADALAARPGSTRPTSVRMGCTSGNKYQDLWVSILKKLGIEHDKYEELQPEDVRAYLETLDYPTLIVVDEFDRLADADTATLFADTIKLLSDEPTNATILIVGVGDSIDDLVADHKSVSRALRQVRIPRMDPGELEEILRTGTKAVELKMSQSQLDQIAGLSEGLPHYTHALGLYAVQRAIQHDRDDMADRDIEAAKALTVRKAQHTIVTAYNKATRSAHQDVLFDKVLLACALAGKDELGMFAARNVVGPLSMIMGKQMNIPAFARHLKQFSGEERGNILQRHGEERRFFYRFDDPMMQPYIILNGLSNHLIDDAMLREIKESVARES